MEITALSSIVTSKFPFELVEHFDLSTSYLKLSLRSDGSIAHFRSLPGGKDYLAGPTAPVWFMRITDKDGGVFKSKSISRTESTLRVGFEGSSVTAKVHVREWPAYLTFELTAIDDHTISSITLLDLPLTLTQHVSSALASCRDGGYAAAVVPLNIQTHSRPIPGSAHAALVAEADGRVRLEGAKFALVGCAPADLLRIVEQIEEENALPHPTLGGTWARLSPEQKRSYLFIDIQDDGAATAAAIRHAHDGGFGYVVVYDFAWAETYGSYNLRLPLESVSKQIHEAGLKLGLHMMDLVVSKNDPLVRPIPQDGFLMYPALETVLAKDIDKDGKTIETTVPPSTLLRAHDFDVYRGRDLRIDDEIITYEDVLLDAASGAVGFSVFERGAHETVPAAHKAGVAIHNFAEFLGHYLPDVRHPLYDKVAKAAATVLNKHAIDFIYPDGIGENVAAWPSMIPVWYAGNLALFGLFESVSRELIFAHFPTSDYAWHVFSRGNTTDYATRGLLAHFDVASLNGADNPSEMQPFELGWFGYFKYSEDAASTRPRELNYAWAKAAGYDSAISLETTQDDLALNGRTRENLSIMKAWENLKLGSAISDTLRTKLRERGKEFAIHSLAAPFLPAAEIYIVTPVDYGAERYIIEVDGVQNVWNFDNPYGSQPLRLSLDANPTFAAYGAPGKVTLLDPAKPIAPRLEGNGPLGRPERGSPKSSLVLTKSAEAAPDGSASARAQFASTSPADKASPATEWACVQLVLDDVEGVKLSGHRGLGTQVKGDGSGAILHFVIEDASQQVRDYYVVLNFTGWKYVPMLEAAAAEVYDFQYVYSNYYALRRIDFGSIRRLYVFVTNAEKGGTVDCQFTRVDALEESALSVRNPGFSINGASVVFPVEIGSEGYMEFDGVSARVYDKDGMLQHNVAATGTVPKVNSGKNSARFFCDSGSTLGQSVKVSLITHGSPLT